MRRLGITVALLNAVASGSLIVSAASFPGTSSAGVRRSAVPSSPSDLHVLIAELQQTNLPAPESGEISLPSGAGMELTKKACTGCHGTDTWAVQRHTKEQWNGIIDNMVSKGLVLSDDDFEKVASYLGANFGPTTVPAATPAPPIAQLVSVLASSVKLQGN